MILHKLVLAVGLALCCTNLAAAEVIGSVLDGDTVVLMDGRRVHLLGINAPEVGKPWGATARDYLAKRVEGQAVRLICENPEETHRRCRVLRRDSDVALELLWEGLAKQHGNLYRYSDYQGQAKGHQRGIWSDQ